MTKATIGLTASGIAAVAIYTLAVFLVMGMIAVLLFERIGVAIPQRA